MRRRKLLLWHIPAEHWPTAGAITALDVDLAGGAPELVDHLGFEWQVISHNLTPADDGGFFLSLWLETDAAPNDAR